VKGGEKEEADFLLPSKKKDRIADEKGGRRGKKIVTKPI